MKKVLHFIFKKHFYPLTSKYKLPGIENSFRIIKALPARKRNVLYTITAIFVLSTVILLSLISNKFLVQIPAHGGSFTEGVSGTPRFVNPVLATSPADKDLVKLVYSGLLRPGKDGQYIGDLAENFEILSDGTEYVFFLRKNLVWHDGEKITSDDIVYTINLIQNETTKSPRRVNWEGITIEKIDEHTVKFTLNQAYAPFLDNATLGILPKHVWEKIPPQEISFSKSNLSAIGSGPYKISGIKKNGEGVPVRYELISFDNFALGKPYIEKLALNFYSSEDELIKAYQKNKIDSVSAISPENAFVFEERGISLKQNPLPRIFGVFINQNQAKVLSDKEVRKALLLATNKQNIIELVLKGYGTSADGPLPSSSYGFVPGENIDTVGPQAERIKEAKRILEEDGWEFDDEEKVLKKKDIPLEFTLATRNTLELKQVAEILQSGWQEIGARVEINLFEIADLNQNVIRPRKYDALLFGETIGRFPDPFAFWHSSQRLDPGLNVALYTNLTVDKVLEEARSSLDNEERLEKYQVFQEEIRDDIPAIFLYSPDLLYLPPDKISNINLSSVGEVSDRFINIHKWYVHTDKIWRIFLK